MKKASGMNAIVYKEKAHLEFADVERPVPGTGEALLRVKLAGICGSDIGAWQGGFARMKPPVILGHEFVGVLEEAASALPKGLHIGDRVVAEPISSCGKCEHCRTGHYNVCPEIKVLGIDANGCFAEMVKVPVERIHLVPSELTTEDAVLCEPLAVALHMRSIAAVQPHHRVAIFGAGPIGLIVGLVCQNAGVAGLAIVERNQFRQKFASRLGLSTIDGNDPMLVEVLKDFFGGAGPDVAFELAGSEDALRAALEITRTRGAIVLGGFYKHDQTCDLRAAILKELDLRGSRMYNFLDFENALSLLARKKIDVGRLVTDTVSLGDAIHGGFERIGSGDSVMKILIDPSKK